MSTREIDLYIFYLDDKVVVSFFKGEEFLDKSEVSKTELGEKLVESFSDKMKDLNISFSNLLSIYFSSSSVTLNANRLVTLFVKTIVSFVDVNLYVRQTSGEKGNIESILNSFVKSREIFRLIPSPLDLVPFYNGNV